MNIYEKYKHIESNFTYWYARDLMVICNYSEWRNFHKIILKAQSKCPDTEKHFIPYHRKAYTNNNGYRLIIDYKLSKYACYLITLNGDIRKENIIKAQEYFK